MNRGDAHAVLSCELRAWQDRPYEQLAALAGGTPSETVVQIGDEAVTIAISVRWESQSKGALRLEATAYGPRSWRLERLEESIVVGRANR